MKEITQEYVKSLFNYRNGFLYWKINLKNNCIKIGDKAGTLYNNGYYNITINGKRYGLHRLIFLYHHGYIPKFIDHIDNNSINNKIENLREVTHQQNMMNQKHQKNKSSIYRGVHWNKRDKVWIVSIRINGKLKHLGSFNDEYAAAFIYNVYARGIFGKYANLNEVK